MMTTFIAREVFFIFLAVTLSVRLWLDNRQIRHVNENRNNIPTISDAGIRIQPHRFAADYVIAKTRMAQIEAIYSTVLVLLWTMGGGINALADICNTLHWPGLIVQTIFLVSFILFINLFELPFNLIKTFNIEKKFGFNRMTGKIYILDTIKQTVLFLIIGFPFIFFLLWLTESRKDWWLWAWLSWLIIALSISSLYPRFIAPLFNQFSPLKNDQLNDRIYRLFKKSGFKANGIFVIDGSKRTTHGNAYFSGWGNLKRIVFYDTLLTSLNPDEIEGVLAHELGHFHYHHVIKNLGLMAIGSLLAFSFIGWLLGQSWLYTALWISHNSISSGLGLFIILTSPALFWIMPLFNKISRHFEFQADNYATTISNGCYLINALVKLYRDNASTLSSDPLYSLFYSSHPPAIERVTHLQSILSLQQVKSNSQDEKR